jgi:hypothetical protein
MTIPVAEPNPHARKLPSDTAAAVDPAGGGGDRCARRGGLRLVAAGAREVSEAIPEELLAGGRGRASETSAVARRLRLAGPLQLELLSARQGPEPEVVWGSLPERAREQVLVLLARLIGSGAVEEQQGGC